MITSEQLIRYKELSMNRKELQKKTTKSLKMTNIFSVVLGLIIGLGISYFSIFSNDNESEVNNFISYFYGGVVAFGISFVIHIIIHEAGHLIFGLLTGYKFLSFRIFSTIFYKYNGKLKKRKYAMKGTGGQCLMYPPKRKEGGQYPFILYNLGGGINNLIFSLIVLIPTLLTDNNIVRTIGIAFILSGTLLGITNLIPLNMGLQNDGMNLKGMLESKELAEAFYIQLKVNAQLSDGKLLSEYSYADFPLVKGKHSANMLAAFGYFYNYYKMLSENKYDEAREFLDHMAENSENYLPANLNLIEIERLFFMVIDKKPIEEIACVYRYVRLILNTAKTNVGIQRVRYIYESLLTEDDKKDIMTLITNKTPKKWKENSEEQVYSDFVKTSENFPIVGEAALHLGIVDYVRNNYNRIKT